jgi:nitric oxide reductase activation protein
MNFESSIIRSQSGKLDANRIWRNIHVNDNKVFNKNYKNDIGNITVDILLDCSASQCERQEVIATQGYIIAESLTRCQIPVKVYSFCSLRGYTIINIYRDYEEMDRNDKIFNYRASGSNRDGLAIRTAVHTMDETQSENKILIVLSDCKPNDIEINPGTGIIPIRTEYSGIKGVNDTAYEVKKGLMKGKKVLCVFTGEDEDVISAKRIYGRNFVRINYLERFADIVGVMLQNQLKNL